MADEVQEKKRGRPSMKGQDAVQEQQLEAVEVKKEAGKVLVNVPHKFKLNVDNHKYIELQPGIQAVDKFIADHQWSKLNGVTIFEVPQT